MMGAYAAVPLFKFPLPLFPGTCDRNHLAGVFPVHVLVSFDHTLIASAAKDSESLCWFYSCQLSHVLDMYIYHISLTGRGIMVDDAYRPASALTNHASEAFLLLVECW